MSNFVFNIAKGRIVEFYNRVESNDPSTSAFILVPLSATEAEATAKVTDTLTAALATALNEQASGGWVRKTLTDAELTALPAPDDTNHVYEVSLPQVIWTAPTAGNNTTGLLLCYDSNTGAGADTDIIPLIHFDWLVTPTGTRDVVFDAGVIHRSL